MSKLSNDLHKYEKVAPTREELSELAEYYWAKLNSFLFEKLDGVPSMHVHRDQGVKTIYHDYVPSGPASVAEKRCLGSYSDKWEDECGAVFCSVCGQRAALGTQFDKNGKRLSPVVALHYTPAIRYCAECDSGIWDEHYLCEVCRVQ